MTATNTVQIPKGKIKFDIKLTEEQKNIKTEILKHPYNFLIGKAGTGKTLLATQIALDLYFTKQIKKIIITRPTVSSEDNGFLPGSLAEKLDPWLVPIRSNMHKVYNKPHILIKLEAEQRIEIISLTHFRGRTFDNAVCIVDEFQNLTTSQLAMAIGRLGENSLMIFTGDEYQIDLKDRKSSAIYKLPTLQHSSYVYSAELHTNHRHPAVFEVLSLFNS